MFREKQCIVITTAVAIDDDDNDNDDDIVADSVRIETVLCIVTGTPDQRSRRVLGADSAEPPSPQDQNHSRAPGAGESTQVPRRRRHLTRAAVQASQSYLGMQLRLSSTPHTAATAALQPCTSRRQLPAFSNVNSTSRYTVMN